jgi:HEAT repeat protein
MEELTLEMLIKNIQSKDDAVRAAARDGAGPVGAEAVLPLAKIAAGSELEIARAANRAIQNIVYFAGRPGAKDEAKAVAGELLKLLGTDQPLQLRRDVLWMTWQIAGEEAVEPVAALLADAELREDARMALERLPGEKATAALKKALAAATDAEKPALAHSLRVRGVQTPGVPDLRLKPTKQTSVKPVGR